MKVSCSRCHRLCLSSVISNGLCPLCFDVAERRQMRKAGIPSKLTLEKHEDYLPEGMQARLLLKSIRKVKL